MECRSNSNPSLEEPVTAPTPTSGSKTDQVAGFPLSEYAIKVDLAMEQNLATARNRYWRTLDASVTGGRSFSDAFGQKPRIAWTSTEYGFLQEIAQFCVEQWPTVDTRVATALLVRAAFRRKGKAHQFLKYWIKHRRGKVSLSPFLVLGGGTQDPTKRRDILMELAADVDVEAGKDPAVQVNEPKTQEGV
jgi:hypothetical protein